MQFQHSTQSVFVLLEQFLGFSKTQKLLQQRQDKLGLILQLQALILFFILKTRFTRFGCAISRLMVFFFKRKYNAYSGKKCWKEEKRYLLVDLLGSRNMSRKYRVQTSAALLEEKMSNEVYPSPCRKKRVYLIINLNLNLYSCICINCIQSSNKKICSVFNCFIFRFFKIISYLVCFPI